MTKIPGKSRAGAGSSTPVLGASSGFLTQYWHSDEPLPRLRGYELLFYLFQRGVRTAVALPLSGIIAVFTTAVALFLFSGFLLILHNVDLFLNRAGSATNMTVFFRYDADPVQTSRFVEQLEEDARFKVKAFISKEQALEILRRDAESSGAFIETLDSRILPDSVDIALKDSNTSLPTALAIADELKETELVEDVVYGSEWVQKMQGLVQVFRFIGFFSLMLTLLIVVFLISNVIKLIIYARRDEIGVMQLVGASDAFIKIPFMIAGLLEGFLGAVFALIFLRLTYALINMQLERSLLLGLTVDEISFLSFPLIFALLLLGVFVGAAGSFFALGRFMR